MIVARNQRANVNVHLLSNVIVGFEAQWNGYAELSITVLMESIALCGVRLSGGDGNELVHYSRSAAPPI